MHLIKIRQIAETTSGGTPLRLNKEYYSGAIPWLKSGELNDGYILGSEEHINEEAIRKSSAKIFSKGTLLIALYGATIGKTGILSIDAATNQAICSLIPKQKDSFHPYYLQQQFIYNRGKLISRSVGGAQPNISQDIIKDFELMIHPYPEQTAIATILSTVDEAIQKADEAIIKTERIKKALMKKLLSEGIGHKEFKQTKIGQIPQKWEVLDLGEIVKVKGGKRLSKGDTLLDERTPYPYIRITDFTDQSVDINKVKYLSKETQRKIRNYTISKNDVYISIAGTIGLAGIIPDILDGANLTENAAKLTELKNIKNNFLSYYLNSGLAQHQIKGFIGKATQPKLALFRIEKIIIPIPSIAEQEKIVNILNDISKKVRLSLRRKSILTKIKQGLMDDLLTGKKRVKIN